MTDFNEKAVRFNMSMSVLLAEKLEKYAKENGLPKSTIVNFALSDFFRQRDMMENGIQLVVETFKNNPEFFQNLIDENKK